MRKVTTAFMVGILLAGSLSAGNLGVMRQSANTSKEILTMMDAVTPEVNATCIGPGCGGPSCSNMPLCPVTVQCANLSGIPAAVVTYSSRNLTASITAVAYAVVTDYLGELVYSTTSSFTVAPNNTTIAYLPIAGLPPDNYTALVFALSPSTSLLISPTTVLTCPFVGQVSFPLGTNTLTLAQPPMFCNGQCGLPSALEPIYIAADYMNNANFTVSGFVITVFQNIYGQVVNFSTQTIVRQPGQSGDAFLPVAGLPSGNYTASVYVLGPDKSAVISETSTLGFTLSS